MFIISINICIKSRKKNLFSSDIGSRFKTREIFTRAAHLVDLIELAAMSLNVGWCKPPSPRVLKHALIRKLILASNRPLARRPGIFLHGRFGREKKTI